MDIEALKQFYIAESHTQLECCDHFHIGRTKLQKIIKQYGLNKDKQSIIPDFQYCGQLLELKGDQFFENGKMINPYDRSQDGLFEAKHLAGLCAGVEFWSSHEMQPILEYIKNEYSLTYLEQYKIKGDGNR